VTEKRRATEAGPETSFSLPPSPFMRGAFRIAEVARELIMKLHEHVNCEVKQK
jgi:hypothetical protein